MSQYNKVTIIIENDDEKVTMRIPVAIDVTVHSEAVIVDDLYREKNGWPRFQPEIMDLTINMRAFFSEKDGHNYVMKREPAIKEVEDAEMHSHFAHPDYEYKTIEGQRKFFSNGDEPPKGEGWERNIDAGENGWERFDFTEEYYWRRKK